MKKIVLASSSPRRRELLERYNLNFEIMASEINEKVLQSEEPAQVAMTLAFQKASDIAQRFHEDALIIAADTVVYMDGILGKPKNEQDAYNMLNRLSGNEHLVITGVALIDIKSEKKLIDYEATKVKFRKLTSEKIKNYLNTKEYMDKAGAYGIQGYGEILVDYVIGSYSNIIGLPIAKLDKLLEKYFHIKIL